MNNHRHTRATALALAFIDAAVEPLQTQGSKAPWTARRVADNADREIGIKSERGINLNLKVKTREALTRKGIIA